MAATSHDFWLANLTAPVWKALHMAVYVAYGLVVLHVALGILQAERSGLLATLLMLGLGWVVGLHLLAARRERGLDAELSRDPQDDGFVLVCLVEEIPENRAKIVTLSGERIAVFRYDGKISALSNVCQHQNGPLGEGVFADGCVTCPWHGFQYLPDSGSSPPPFNEKVPTFRTRIDGVRVFVHPRPNPAGTRVEPALCGETTSRRAFNFYVGYVAKAPAWVAEFLKPRLLVLAATALALALLITVQQRPFAASTHEYQTFRPFEGTVVERPYPMLLVGRPGLTPKARSVSVFPLTVFGKRSAAGAVESLDGSSVELEAELIYRDGQTMLQLRDGSIRALGAAATKLELEYVGEATLSGEIVDSKCYLGVMKPGRQKPHRSCAALCIRGGVPPLLLVEEENGGRLHYLLMGEEGDRIGRDILGFVGERVRIVGDEYRLADLRVLAADPRTFERLP